MLQNLRFLLLLFLMGTLGARAQTLFSEDFNTLSGTTAVPTNWV
ncbi:MAG: hypothetical protein RIT39_692, partial [Bacteroidota bacterium]